MITVFFLVLIATTCPSRHGALVRAVLSGLLTVIDSRGGAWRAFSRLSASYARGGTVATEGLVG
ncbi:MAG: hypothetical protein WKF72_09745, partial [Nocardioidaceae bacterium]